MGLLDELNPYSRRFAERLFAAYPGWEVLAGARRDPGGPDHGDLELRLRAPAQPPREMRISTADGGGESPSVLVWFGTDDRAGPGCFHDYGGLDGLDERAAFAAALDTIAAILAERLVAATGRGAGGGGVSTFLGPDEPVDFGAAPEIEYVEVISWRGTHDRWLPA